MRTSGWEDLLHYNRELTYLRKAGGEFAEALPEDRQPAGTQRRAVRGFPHVERLIESFAFLTGRIQHDIESSFRKSPRQCWACCIRSSHEPDTVDEHRAFRG